jgi:transcriptional regulator with XRE-family HTH domain
MRPKEIKDARKKLGLSRSALASLVGCSSRSIDRWETGETEPRGIYVNKLEEILLGTSNVEKPFLTLRLRRVGGEITDYGNTVHIPAPPLVEPGETVEVRLFRLVGNK